VLVVRFTFRPPYSLENEHRYNGTEGWMGHRAGMDAVENRKILRCRDSNSSRQTSDHLTVWAYLAHPVGARIRKKSDVKM
jgi:hypothetical protein